MLKHFKKEGFLYIIENLFSISTVAVTLSLYFLAGVPKNVDYTVVRKELETIPGVRMAHSLHVWSLTTTCSAMAVHLAVGKIDVWAMTIIFTNSSKSLEQVFEMNLLKFKNAQFETEDS